MGKRKDGITTLAKLRQRCIVRDPDGCWIWKGAEHNGKAAVWLAIPDARGLHGAPRAALILSGKALGPRTWTTCKDPMCCNPAHAATGTYREWGAWVRETQKWVGNELNVAAARVKGRKRSKINMSIAREIRQSPLPPLAEAKRLREAHGIEISRTLVDNVRKQKRWAEPSPFAGLGAR